MSKEARLKNEYRQRIESAEEIFDECGGDFIALAERLPGTDAGKMRAYVDAKLRQYQQHAVAQKLGDADRFQEYRRPKLVWARAHVDGVFYD